MFKSEFNYTHVYYHLRDHFKYLKLPQRDNKNVLEEMKRLHKIESPNMYDCAMMSMEIPKVKEERNIIFPAENTTFRNSSRGY